MISVIDRKLILEYQKLAMILRNNDINTIIYYNDVKLKNQLNYADNICINITIVMGENEFKDGKVKIRDMWLNNGKKKEEYNDNSLTVNICDMVNTVRIIMDRYQEKNKEKKNVNFRKYSEFQSGRKSIKNYINK